MKAILEKLFSRGSKTSSERNDPLQPERLEDLRLVAVLSAHTSSVTSVVFSIDGKLALSGGYDASLKLWKLPKGKCIKVLQGDESVIAVALSPDVKYALSWDRHHVVKQWDVQSCRCLGILFQGEYSYESSVVFSQDCRSALVADENLGKGLKLWNIEDGKYYGMHGHDGHVNTATLSLDGRLALSGGQDAKLMLWELDTHSCIRVLKGHTDAVMSVAFSPDCRYALSGERDHCVRLWDLQKGTCAAVFEGHTDYIGVVSFLANGRCALSGGADKSIRLWDIPSGRCLSVLQGHTERIVSLSVSQDSTYVLSASNDIRLWKTGRSG